MTRTDLSTITNELDRFAIAGAKQHLTDWHVEVGAFRRERTSVPENGERLDTRRALTLH